MSLGRYRHRVTDLLVVGRRLWVATADAGIVPLSPDGRPGRAIEGAGAVVWDLEPAGEGGALAATPTGVYRLDARGRRRATVATGDVRSIARRGRTIWTAAAAGAWRIDERGHRTRIAGVPDQRVVRVSATGSSSAASTGPQSARAAAGR